MGRGLAVSRAVSRGETLRRRLRGGILRPIRDALRGRLFVGSGIMMIGSGIEIGGTMIEIMRGGVGIVMGIADARGAITKRNTSFAIDTR